MLRRRHVRPRFADGNSARAPLAAASAAEATRITRLNRAPHRSVILSPSPASLSLPAIAQSPLHAATYAFCRLKRIRRHKAKQHNSTDGRISHATNLLAVTDGFCRRKCTRRQHAKRRHASDDEKGPVEGVSHPSRSRSPVCDASIGPPLVHQGVAQSVASVVAIEHRRTAQSPVPTDTYDFCRQNRARRHIGSRRHSTPHASILVRVIQRRATPWRRSLFNCHHS
jgi:hypothetical protein